MGEEDDSKWARLIKKTAAKGTKNQIHLCNDQGLYETRTISRSSYGFKFSKKLKWGDRWMFPYDIPNKYRKESKFSKKSF